MRDTEVVRNDAEGCERTDGTPPRELSGVQHVPTWPFEFYKSYATLYHSMASVWDWTIGYLVVFAALQIAVYVYYRRQVDDGPVPDPTGGDPDTVERVASNRSVRNDDEGTDSRRCPHCGASNEPDTRYRYCRNCARSLSTA